MLRTPHFTNESNNKKNTNYEKKTSTVNCEWKKADNNSNTERQEKQQQTCGIRFHLSITPSKVWQRQYAREWMRHTMFESALAHRIGTGHAYYAISFVFCVYSVRILVVPFALGFALPFLSQYVRSSDACAYEYQLSACERVSEWISVCGCTAQNTCTHTQTFIKYNQSSEHRTA